MSLKLTYYGQNDGSTVPECTLTGDPGTDQAALTSAGFLGGKIMSLTTAVLAQNTSVSITPCDSASMVPYATLLNGPGEFAGAIGPSGSRKAPVVRAMWQGIVIVMLSLVLTPASLSVDTSTAALEPMQASTLDQQQEQAATKQSRSAFAPTYRRLPNLGLALRRYCKG
jgi:hypothetical protein